MIKDIKMAIEEPMVPLDHLLDRRFYFRFHPKIELSEPEQDLADGIRTGLKGEPPEQPSILRRALNRIFRPRKT